VLSVYLVNAVAHRQLYKTFLPFYALCAVMCECAVRVLLSSFSFTLIHEA